MKDTAPSHMQGDALRFMRGVVHTLRMAGGLASRIEESGLGRATPGHMPEHWTSALQQMDLLQQSLAELERLSEQAMSALAAGDPVDPLMCDIRLEAVAACFDRSDTTKHPPRGNPRITLFD